MQLPYIIWRGVRSDAMKVLVNEYPPIIRAKERVATLTVPGRPGTLTLTEGDEAYEPTLRPAVCTLLPGADIEAVCAWLTGGGQAVFGNEPNRAYDARIINQIQFDKILRGRRHMRFDIPFYCQPLKYQYPAPTDIIVTASNTSISNPGNVSAAPVVALTGSGDMTLTLGMDTVVLDEVSGGIVIDSGMGDCYSLDKGQLLNYKMTGAFPRLRPGTNTIRWTGNVQKVVITPRWRWI